MCYYIGKDERRVKIMINERVRQIRAALKMTQTDFGKRISVSQNYLTNIETGRREITEKLIKLICLEYNVNEEWLRDGKGPMFIENDETIISEVAAQYHLGDLDKAIMKVFLELSPEKREAFKEFAFSLVDTVLNDDALYMEYREKYVENNALPYAARGGDTSNLDEAAELFDEAMEKEDKQGEE